MAHTLFCRSCKKHTKWEKGKAFLNTLTGIPDFPGDSYVCTVSRTGPAKLVSVCKCSECGRSFTMPETRTAQKAQARVKEQELTKWAEEQELAEWLEELRILAEWLEEGIDT